MRKRITQLCILLCSALISAVGSASELTEDQLWQALASTHHVAIMRHAIAPGIGDPSNFTLGERDTQRNLSNAGVNQAKRIGDRFREQGITEADVYSSEWFRCLDTANLLAFGGVTPQPLLNSFFQDTSQKGEQTQELRQWIIQQNTDTPRVLVTHQVNITALTGVYPSSGEIVVLRVGEGSDLTVLGTIKTQ
ncbi:histidine phosphatase family protein [Neptunomonas phycophila]|uniref:histidine phosphatase family protein n=1 Tax=Neptunomonas phycophila TaxID=1572645 RepID=UPI000948C785|nr:histidine phosphatase family protein [Neptunomonas phycophila]